MDKLYERDNEYGYGRVLLAAFVILMPILCLLPRWVFHYVESQHFILEQRNLEPIGRIGRALDAFPLPRLQAEPSAELQQFKQEQLHELSAYAWTDKERGLVRVPIDEAMRRYLAATSQPATERKP